MITGFFESWPFSLQGNDTILGIVSYEPRKETLLFLCLCGKKRSKSTQVCEYEHIGKWEKIPATDQIKILKHCHATQGKKIWLDADTFSKHKNIIFLISIRTSSGIQKVPRVCEPFWHLGVHIVE